MNLENVYAAWNTHVKLLSFRGKVATRTKSTDRNVLKCIRTYIYGILKAALLKHFQCHENFNFYLCL